MKNHSLVFALSLLAVLPAAAAEEPPLSHEEIKSTVDRHLADVKGCMKEHGSATGKLVVKFLIRPDGRTMAAAPDKASSNAALDKCIAAQFLKWEFPKPRGGVTMAVVYPFLFAAPPPPATLAKEQVAETVRGKAAEIKKCYDEALTKKTDLAGTVTVEISVAPTGQVADAKVVPAETTTKSPPVEGCIAARVKTWQFPKPTGGAGNFVFQYPFVLVVPKAPAKKDDEAE